MERAMQRAWGLHRQAQFKDIGDNRFVVRFSSEGDWRHVLKGGPWQFDFHVVLLKDYVGSVRPSDMVFDELDIHVRVLDLPMDLMNRAYRELIGGWIGRFISVDVDEDGFAWGKDLRIRVTIRVDQPLLRGVNIKSSEEDVEGKWFDLKYEKVPHFCFDCGRLVHSEGECQFEKGEAQQWGEWLHASPPCSQKPPSNPCPSISIGSFSSRSMNSDHHHSGGITVRDIPPRRNLLNDFQHSNSSRTGEREERRGENNINSTDNSKRGSVKERLGVEAQGGNSRGGRTGTFVWKPRSQNLPSNQDGYQVPLVTRV
jgi:hypothetical protein